MPTRLLAARLAAKGVPTVLYEAPSHFWYIGSCVGAGCFLFAFAAGQYNLVAARPPEGVVWWAPPFFGAMIIIFGAMGTAFILRARGIVAMIRAVPAASAAAAGKQAGKQAAGWLRGSRVAAKAIAEGGGETGPLLIEVTVKNLVPFRARRPMLYKPEEVRLPYPLAEPMAELAARAAAGGRRVLSAAERLAEEEKKKAYLQYDRDHLLTAPFRHLFKVVKAAFRGLRKGLSGEGVIKIKTKDDTLRLDLDGGWALDHGRALDKLLKVGSLP